jgi:hypothetical protein
MPVRRSVFRPVCTAFPRLSTLLRLREKTKVPPTRQSRFWNATPSIVSSMPRLRISPSLTHILS